MTFVPPLTTPTRWRRIVPTALCAAAVALGGAALAGPAVASAEPNSGEWDIGEYDQCMGYVNQEVAEGKSSDEAIHRHMNSCCTETGGVLGANDICQAPPAEPAQVRPGLIPLPGATLQPATPTTTPPPVGNLPTFAPSIG
jgi:hypothetical protein